MARIKKNEFLHPREDEAYDARIALDYWGVTFVLCPDGGIKRIPRLMWGPKKIVGVDGRVTVEKARQGYVLYKETCTPEEFKVYTSWTDQILGKGATPEAFPTEWLSEEAKRRLAGHGPGKSKVQLPSRKKVEASKKRAKDREPTAQS